MGSNSITRRRTGDTYTCYVAIRNHGLVLDEPASVGGNDEGPTPVELVTAALGGCTAITMQLYARRKGWNISRLEVAVEHETVNAPAATLEGRVAKQDRFRMRILLEGDLDVAQRERIFDIAKRCPVHRMLAGTPIVVSEFIDSFDSVTE
jgi:putative redox protein